MKRFVRGMKISSFCICVVASLWAVHSFTVRVFHVDRFFLQLDSAFSKAQREAITNFFKNNQTLKTTSLAVVAQRAREQFPSIKKISLNQNASGVIVVQTDSVCPVFRVNDDLVLTDYGSLFKKILFDKAVLNKLNAIKVKHIGQHCDGVVIMEQNELVGALPQLLETVQNLPSALFREYRVSCRNNVCWSLEDKQQKNFLIFFNGAKVPDDTVICACNKVKKTLDARGAFTGRRVRTWIADARFEDQVILFRQTGGR